MQYRPEIDGLRAIAVVPVILFHAGFGYFGGGFVGVDVFFVISGFLITSILLRDLESGNYSILKFYERRARRILPALLFVMLVTFPFAVLFLTPGDMRDYVNSILSTLTFVSNIYFWQQSSYFDTAAEFRPLLHTWSLSVEEQFYVFFPVFLALIWATGRRTVFGILTGIFFISLGIAEWGHRNEPTANFFLLPTRGWELLIGSLAAMVRRDQLKFVPPSAQNLLSLLGLVMIITSVFIYNETTPFPSVYALLPTMGTCFIILFAHAGTICHAILKTRVMVGIGLISFSAYLWHQPLFVFARIQPFFDAHSSLFLVLILVTFALSYLTWRFVEAPFRNSKIVSVPKLISSLAVTSIVLAALALTINFFPDRYLNFWNNSFPERVLTNSAISRANREDSAIRPTQDQAEGPNCVFHRGQISPNLVERLNDCAAVHGPGIVILGDSHAIDLYFMATYRFDSEFVFGAVSGGCRPHTPKKGCHYDDFLKMIEDNPNLFSRIIFEQAGFYLLQRDANHEGNRSMVARLMLNESVEDLNPNETYIERTAAYLDKVAQSVPVTWFGPRIEPHITDQIINRHGCDHQFNLRPGTYEIFDRLDQTIIDRLSQSSNVSYLSQNEVMDFEYPADFGGCDGIYWSDGDHFSAAGEIKFGERLPDDFLSPRP